MKAFFLFPVIHHHIEAAGHGDQELMALLQGVTGAVRASRHIVKVKHALDREGNVSVAFDECQIAARIGYFGQLQQTALAQFHSFFVESICLSARLGRGAALVPILGPVFQPIGPMAPNAHQPWTNRPETERSAPYQPLCCQ